MDFLKRILPGLVGSKSPEPASTYTKLIETFLRETPPDHFGRWFDNDRVEDHELGRTTLALVREEQVLMAEALVAKLVELDRKIDAFTARLKSQHERWNRHIAPGWSALWYPRSSLTKLVKALLRRKLPWESRQLTAMALWCASADQLTTHHYPLTGLLSAVAERRDRGELEADLKEALAAILPRIHARAHDKELLRLAAEIEILIGRGARIPIEPGETWAEAALADLAALPPSKKEAWIEVLTHCLSATGASPSAKWSNTAAKLLEHVLSADDFEASVLRWFPLVDKPLPREMRWPSHVVRHPLSISDRHADILRGLVWISGTRESKEIARAVGALAISSYRKIPGVGPRLVRVGNACIHTLGAMPGNDGIGQLALLRVRVKFATAQKMLDKALGAAAKRAGLPMEDLEEMAIPAYGLDEVGKGRVEFGEFTAEIAIEGAREVSIAWKSAAGKTQKSVPAAVKENFAEDFKELKSTEKDIARMLPAQAERIDQLYLRQKTWPLATWRERYLDHPLVGVLARRLIWRFHDGVEIRDGLWLDGQIRDRQQQPIQVTGDTVVSLWHPRDAGTDGATAWQRLLEEHEIRQPFKQAHREIYLLTPAEETTRTYSNRFAAHILRQHQFHALCQQRGWKNKLRLMVDDSYPPAHILLPGWNLRAEFWIEGAGNEYGTDTNESGSYLYLSTDQVRFYPLQAPQFHAHAGGGGYGLHRGQESEPLNLDDVPPLVFSELMRDVDLFVGVASVGNDPNWSDNGRNQRHATYWSNFSFGDLTASAKTRKGVLERLIPRLKIADRCGFQDKFLVVRGDIRTYKIHLGSGNILMLPGDQYLCIVAKPTWGESDKTKIFLPFEGDEKLSVILSKAFLLAADSKIKDSSITRQIGPAPKL